MPEPTSEFPHRRCNPLTGRWILVSPHRTLRPWQGKRESTATEQRLPHDPQCYLCPGNVRAVDAVNPAYAGTRHWQLQFPDSRDIVASVWRWHRSHPHGYAGAALSVA